MSQAGFKNTYIYKCYIAISVRCIQIKPSEGQLWSKNNIFGFLKKALLGAALVGLLLFLNDENCLLLFFLYVVTEIMFEHSSTFPPPANIKPF